MATLILFSVLAVALAASKDKPHSHSGVLKAYDGKQISYTLTKDQQKKLDSGNPIVIKEAKGKDGRGFVLQDIEAPGTICMDKIKDLKNYHKMVPHVKSVEVYEEETFANGTTRSGAKFNVGVLGMRFSYFLVLTHEPKYNTYTWTLDFRYSSDFDDTVGHWQVMPHPTKPGFTRVLYSTQLKLPSWVPGLIVNFLTKSALVESTSWVLKESEKEFKNQGKITSLKGGDKEDVGATSCYTEDEAGAHYDSDCFLKSTTTISDENPTTPSSPSEPIQQEQEPAAASSSEETDSQNEVVTDGGEGGGSEEGVVPPEQPVEPEPVQEVEVGETGDSAESG